MDLCAEDDVGLIKNRFRALIENSLAELKIWGPAGAGDPAPAPGDPTRYTRKTHHLAPKKSILINHVSRTMGACARSGYRSVET